MSEENKVDIKILKHISKESGLTEFWLGGSFVYRKVAEEIGVYFKHDDYDLAIQGRKSKCEEIVKTLKAHRFKIIKNRPYYLKFNNAFQVIAVKDSLHLDIAIVSKISDLGHFNWESIFWHFPSGKIYDQYNSLSAIKQRRLEPLISLKEENPFILASRFAKLCARFDVDFYNEKKLFRFAQKSAKKVSTWNSTDSFHGKYARGHAYFGILQAIIRAPKRNLFLTRLQKTGLFRSFFPELNQKINLSKDLRKKFGSIKTIKELVYFLKSLLKGDSAKSKIFQRRLTLISDRLCEDEEKNKSMQKLRLYNTLSRSKELFIPLKKNKVSLYTCGLTVYDFAHIGNLRAYIFADILKSVLELNKFKVKHVMNITDVGHLTSDADEGEDKMELSAHRTGKSAWEIAEFYTKKFKEDMINLNIKFPDVWCKATEHIKEQIELIKKLEDKGYTYKISDGIYYNTSKFKSYGTMARLNRQGLKTGARVAFHKGKKNPTDFALWKFSLSKKKRQMEWNSPWGIGFPGWHIECSAMSMRYLGDTIDIHTGGTDHIPIHHTNEIAQSEAATSKTFVRYWLHSAFLLVEGDKMSKSLKNTFTLQDIIKKGYDPLSLRYLFLTSHYRSLMNFTWKSLEGAENALRSIRNIISQLGNSKTNKDQKGDYNQEIVSIINNDLDTSGLIALLWETIKSDQDEKEKLVIISEIDQILGLDLKRKEDKDIIPPKVKQLVKVREKLRREKKWSNADKIRKQIFTLGYTIEDASSGSRLLKNCERSKG